MLKVYTDAAVKGNPGPAGMGILITGGTNQVQISEALKGEWDNHTAEFEAIYSAMIWLVKNKQTDQMIFLFSDSRAAVDALHKGSSKNINYQKYLDLIYALEDNFQYISIEWINEGENRGADRLARQALHKIK